MSKKYIWWMEFDEAFLDPYFIVSQVMNIGDAKDSGELLLLFEEEFLRNVIINAKTGRFNDKVAWGAWNNWLFPEYNFKTPPMLVRSIP